MPMHRERGYSYLFVLMAIALIGVGLSVAAEIYSVSVRRDQERELLFIGNQFRDAIRRYYEASPGGQKQYPESLDVLLRDQRLPGTHRHLRKLYSDPLTGKVEWGVVRVAGRIVGIHSLSAEKPIKVANFDLPEISFEGKARYSDWVFTYPPTLIVNKALPLVGDSVSDARNPSAGKQ